MIPPGDESGDEPGSEHDDALAARSRSQPPPEPGATARLFVLRLPPERPLVMPSECACCGAPPSHEMRAENGAGYALLINYCDACARHVAGSGTRQLAFTLAALLASVALAAALPIAVPWSSALSCASLAFLGALLPLALAARGLRAAAGHAARGAAVYFRSPRELVCRRAELALKLAEAADAPLTTLAKPRWRLGGASLLVLGLALALALWSHAYHHPELRVLNLTDAEFVLTVDDHALGPVEPSSGESPLAGRELRVPAGSRLVRAVAPDGQVVAQARVEIVAGRRHLYAPASPKVCFWLETASYGRERAEQDFEPLLGKSRFWLIPDEVQGWFTPNAPLTSDSRATGGSSTTLRQRPCDEGPPSALQ